VSDSLARALDDLRAHTASDGWYDPSAIDAVLNVLHADEHASAHWDGQIDDRHFAGRRTDLNGRHAYPALRKRRAVRNIDEPGL
jgi:hypothetical protein